MPVLKLFSRWLKCNVGFCYQRFPFSQKWTRYAVWKGNTLNLKLFYCKFFIIQVISPIFKIRLNFKFFRKPVITFMLFVWIIHFINVIIFLLLSKAFFFMCRHTKENLIFFQTQTKQGYFMKTRVYKHHLFRYVHLKAKQRHDESMRISHIKVETKYSRMTCFTLYIESNLPLIYFLLQLSLFK